MSLSVSRKKMRKIEAAARVDQKMLESAASATRFVAYQLRRQFLSYYFVTPPLWKVILRASLGTRRMTPAFASLGAVRSGTSLLSDYIMQHPCVVLPLAKEIGLTTLPRKSLIMAQFPSHSEQAQVERTYGGRAITGYCAPIVPLLAFPHVASTIVPPEEGVKFIIIIRNPVDRTFSHWNWDSVLLRHAAVDPLWKRYPTFEEMVRLELESIRTGGGGLTTISGVGGGGYIQHSICLPFLKCLLQFYDKERIMFVQAEEFFKNPAATAKAVYRFLDLPDFEPTFTPPKNAGPSATMDAETRQLLQEFFAPLNEELFEFIGTRFSWK